LAPDLVGAPGAGEGDDALLSLAATAPPGCEGLVMVPYLVAERAPMWDPDVPAAFLGLRPTHTRAHLARAAVEGVCLNVALVLDQLDRLAPVRSVRATGGTFESALWREVAGGLLDRPLRVLDGVEGTALGAAALGVFALGREPTLEAALASLCDLDAHLGPPETPPPELVATYRAVRHSVPGLIAGLGRLAPFYGEPS
jgi:gluconokinase